MSWAFNYKAVRIDLFGDNRLCKKPNQVASNYSISLAVSFWFWKANVNSNVYVQNRQFGATTNIIIGALECKGENNNLAKTRFKYYSVILKAFKINETPIEN